VSPGPVVVAVLLATARAGGRIDCDRQSKVFGRLIRHLFFLSPVPNHSVKMILSSLLAFLVALVGLPATDLARPLSARIAAVHLPLITIGTKKKYPLTMRTSFSNKYKRLRLAHGNKRFADFLPCSPSCETLCLLVERSSQRELKRFGTIYSGPFPFCG
jgi:hypothetical protein